MRKKNAIGLILILPKSAAFHCGSIISILFANMCFYRERYSNKLSKDSLSQIDCRQIDCRFANQVFTKLHIPLFVCGNNATLEERHVIYVYSLLSVINSNLKLAKKSMLAAGYSTSYQQPVRHIIKVPTGRRCNVFYTGRYLVPRAPSFYNNRVSLLLGEFTTRHPQLLLAITRLSCFEMC